jgi:hypothetical protein
MWDTTQRDIRDRELLETSKTDGGSWSRMLNFADISVRKSMEPTRR